MNWRWIAGVVLTTGGACLALAMLFYWLPKHINRTDTVDHEAYLRAAKQLANNEPVYGETRANNHLAYKGFLYPPPALALFRPIAPLTRHQFNAVWYPIVLGAFWVFAFGLTRMVTEPTAPKVLSTGLILALVPNMSWTLSYGNVDLIIWAMVAIALTSTNDHTRAILLTLAGCLKVYPLFLLVFTKRSSWLTALATLAIVMALTLTVIGPERFTEYRTNGLPVILEGCFDPGNWSFSTLIAKTSGVQILSWYPPLAIAAVLVALMRAPWFDNTSRGAIGMAFCAALSPVWWFYQLPVVAFAAAGLVRWRRAS